jgi:hypothetical protein
VFLGSEPINDTLEGNDDGGNIEFDNGGDAEGELPELLVPNNDDDDTILPTIAPDGIEGVPTDVDEAPTVDADTFDDDIERTPFDDVDDADTDVVTVAGAARDAAVVACRDDLIGFVTISSSESSSVDYSTHHITIQCNEHTIVCMLSVEQCVDIN